jgi:hypothetical protein
MAVAIERVCGPKRTKPSYFGMEAIVFAEAKAFIKGMPGKTGELDIWEITETPSEKRWLENRRMMEFGFASPLTRPPSGSMLEGLAPQILNEQKYKAISQTTGLPQSSLEPIQEAA